MVHQSMFGRTYSIIYEFLAGRHPYQRPWHHQWSAVSGLHKELRKIVGGVTGNILDVGCGTKPYEGWFSKADLYVGIDIHSGEGADVVIDPHGDFPFSDCIFDTVTSFEVLEHVEMLDKTTSEILRVTKDEGRVIISVPFLYNEHGFPHDYRRFTRLSSSLLFARGAKIEEVKLVGGIGTTCAILFLNWIEVATNTNKLTRFAKALLLPVFLVTNFSVNVLAAALDKIDCTNSFYHHVIFVYRKCTSPDS